MPPDSLNIHRDGAQLFAGAAKPHINELRGLFSNLPRSRAGARLSDLSSIRSLLLPTGNIGAVAAATIGAAARPVRAILFDKSEEANWGLSWHQDRTICVAERVEAPDFGPWTTKAGLIHVSPPYALLSQMATIRVHLDDVDACNAPLLIVPGSHRLGVISEGKIDATVAKYGAFECLASAGDIWSYSTPILHASNAAGQPGRRRVLQVDYAAFDLPNGLKWRTLL